MEIRWGTDKKHTRKTVIDAQVREDAAETIVRERRHTNWIDQILADHERNGGFENLEGKGKPLNLQGEVTENYYLHRVLKNANVLPPWLDLQHEVRDMLKSLVNLVEQKPDTEVKHHLSAINDKIRKFNRACPTPLLEKPYVNEQNYTQQVHQWE